MWTVQSAPCINASYHAITGIASSLAALCLLATRLCCTQIAACVLTELNQPPFPARGTWMAGSARSANKAYGKRVVKRLHWSALLAFKAVWSGSSIEPASQAALDLGIRGRACPQVYPVSFPVTVVCSRWSLLEGVHCYHLVLHRFGFRYLTFSPMI